MMLGHVTARRARWAYIEGTRQLVAIGYTYGMGDIVVSQKPSFRLI